MSQFGQVFHNAIEKMRAARSKHCAEISESEAANLAAERALRRRLANLVRESGPEDAQSLTARVELANFLHINGRPDEADVEYAEALRAYRKFADDADHKVLILEFTRAQSLMRRGDLAGAKRKLVEICDMSSQAYGTAEANTLLYLDSLAATLVRLGERENAKGILLTVLDARLKAGPLNHGSPEEASATISTAGVVLTSYLNDERWMDALPLQMGIVALLRGQRSDTDSELLLASSLLAVMLLESGQLQRARILLQLSADAFVRGFGREHPETLRVFLLLGLIYERQDEVKAALAVIERSYAVARVHLGEEHEISLRLATKLASLQLRTKQYAAARTLLIEILPIAERTTGHDSATTLANLNNLAVAIWKQGNWSLARSVAEEVVRRKIARQGEEHPDTRQSIEQLQMMDANIAGESDYPMGKTANAAIDWERPDDGEGFIFVRLRGNPNGGWKQ